MTLSGRAFALSTLMAMLSAPMAHAASITSAYLIGSGGTVYEGDIYDVTLRLRFERESTSYFLDTNYFVWNDPSVIMESFSTVPTFPDGQDPSALVKFYDYSMSIRFDDSGAMTSTLDVYGRIGRWVYYGCSPFGGCDSYISYYNFNSTTDTWSINVLNAAPTIGGLSVDSQAQVNQDVTLSAWVSDPGTADILGVSIDWGDGSALWEAGDLPSYYAFNVAHQYSQAGIYNAMLTVFDDDGGVSTQAFSVEVTAVPLPAAAWLLASGLLGLIGVGRKRRR